MKNPYVSLSKTAVWMFALLAIGVAGHAKPRGIEGTWIGGTQTPPGPQVTSSEWVKDDLTLVVSKAGGAYDVRFSDTLGYASNTPCQEVSFSKEQLRFKFALPSGESIAVALTVKKDVMTGSWIDPDGDGAPIQLRRQRQK